MKNVLLLLAKGFEMIEASAFIDVIGWNASFGDKSVSLKICGVSKEIVSTFDVHVTSELLLHEVDADDFDALAIPGGFGTYGFYEDAHGENFLELIRRFNMRNKIIASICVGSIPLAKSGILNGRRATTYNKNGGKRQKQLAGLGVDVIDQPVVIDGNIITSWNPSTAFDVAFTLLEKLTSKENAASIRELMGF